MAKKRSRNTEPVRGKHAAHAAPPARPAAEPARAAKQRPQQAQTQAPSQAQPQVQSRPAQSSKQHSVRSAKKKRRIPLPLKIVLVVVLVAALAGGGFLVWDYLFRYDDAKDFQGQWKIGGTNSSIVITDSEIRLTDSVSFGYELNTFEKTLTYSYASFTGKSSYVFSPERDVFTLTDMNTAPDEGDTDQSMHLLKVSNQAVGEPETANNNDTSDAQTYGADVVSGSMSAQQAENADDHAGGAATGGN